MSASPANQSEHALEYSGRPLVNVCIAFGVLQTFFVIAFIFSWHVNRDGSSHNTKGVYALIVLAYMLSLGGIVISIFTITIGGVGYHAETLQPETVRTTLQLMTAHEATYRVAVALPKLAILSLYLRLFREKNSRYLLYVTGGVIVIACIVGLIAVFVNCRPLSSIWSLRLENCTLNPMTGGRLYSIPIIATDVVILVLPMTALWRLRVNAWEKFAVTLTFLVMACGIITAIVRLVFYMSTDVFGDPTYLCVPTAIMTIIEPAVYLLAAMVPTLKPTIRQFCKRIPPICAFAPFISRFGPHPQSVSDVPEVPAAQRLSASRAISTKKSHDTFGPPPKKTLQLDDYHHRLRYGTGLVSFSSVDEESMVCADAIVHETMGREGRNPDGTLKAFSLQPMQFSPMRTSFFFDKSDSEDSRHGR